MKIDITFKDPDAVWEALLENDIDPNSEYGEKIQKRLAKWFTYGEYVTLDYDTETDSMKILEKSP